jgi:hypothetical protein
MNKILATFAVAVTVLVVGFSPARATTKFAFLGDNSYFWGDDGTTHATNATTWHSPEGGDNVDHIGTPDINDNDKPAAVFDAVNFRWDESGVDDDAARLFAIDINYSLFYSASVNDDLQLGDIFIDDKDDGDWDYVIRLSDVGRGILNIDGTGYDIYDFQGASRTATDGILIGSRATLPGGTPITYAGGSTTYDYVFTGTGANNDNNGTGNDNGAATLGGDNVGVDWSFAGNIRNDHPWALANHHVDDAGSPTYDAKYALAGVLADGWDSWVGDPDGGGPLTHSDYNLDINIGSANASGANPGDGLRLSTDSNGAVRFRVGFAFNCANDVVWEVAGTGTGQSEVPEPTSLALMLTGLAGMAYKKRRCA